MIYYYYLKYFLDKYYSKKKKSETNCLTMVIKENVHINRQVYTLNTLKILLLTKNLKVSYYALYKFVPENFPEEYRLKINIKVQRTQKSQTSRCSIL